MKTVLLSIAAAATLAAAAPAMSADWNHDGRDGRYGYGQDVRYGGRDINDREREISMRIDRGVRDGSLNWREARSLRMELARVENLEQRYRYGGINGFERADLNARLDRLSLQVRGQRHDRDYGYGYGYDHSDRHE
jgi:hypothetical protein